MALIPDVAPDQIITSGWGNSIRNCSVQQFASEGQLKAWTAPTGSVGVDIATGRYWIRRAGAWWPTTIASTGGTFAGSTDANGQLSFPHGFFTTPTWVNTTGSANTNTAQVLFVSVSATNLRVELRNATGALAIHATVSGFYQVGL